jgi:hypothetical protein
MRMGRSRAAYADERYERDQEPNVSIVPAGTGISICIISQHFVLGYFRWVPTGRAKATKIAQFIALRYR